jgi:hypothetical protein
MYFEFDLLGTGKSVIAKFLMQFFYPTGASSTSSGRFFSSGVGDTQKNIHAELAICLKPENREKYFCMFLDEFETLGASRNSVLLSPEYLF